MTAKQLNKWLRDQGLVGKDGHFGFNHNDSPAQRFADFCFKTKSTIHRWRTGVHPIPPWVENRLKEWRG